MNRPFILCTMALVGCALAASLLCARSVHADFAFPTCYPGFAAYEADGTISTMSYEGRWQRFAPGSTDPFSEVQTGVWVSCEWETNHSGEVAPDGSYMVVYTQESSLLRVTPTDSQPLLDNWGYGHWDVGVARDGRALLVAKADTTGDDISERLLFVESEVGSGEFPVGFSIGERCPSNRLMFAAALSDERVAVICPQGFLILDIDTGEVYRSDVLGSLADDFLHAVDSWSDGDGVVLYVLSGDGAVNPDGALLSHVRMDVDGTVTMTTIADDFIGWPRELAAVSENSVAVHGNDGLELWQRDSAGAWSKVVVAPEFDGAWLDAMAEPTRLLVSGWNVTEYTLGADGEWQTREFLPVGLPPYYGSSGGCNSGGAGSGAPLIWLLLVGAVVAGVRRRSA